MVIHLKTDSAKSRRGSQPEAEFPAFPQREWGGVLPVSTPGLRGVQLTRLQARERMKTSIFILGFRLKQQRRGSRGATPKSESEDSHHGGAWERTGRPPDGGISIQSI